MTFATPEREFLRLAALANPDWTALRHIARTALDYGALRDLALLHQLDGVIAWRLKSPELDGTVPNIVRDDCAGYLAWLHQANQPYCAAVVEVLTRLTEAGVEFAVLGGPWQYAPLGITDEWCREWQDIDIHVHADDPTVFAQARAAVSAHWRQQWEYWWACDYAPGVRIEMGEHDPTSTTALLDICADTEPRVFAGVAAPVPTAPGRLAMTAIKLWQTAIVAQGRLSLWQLARIANEPDWTACYRAIYDAWQSPKDCSRYHSDPGVAQKLYGERPLHAYWALEVARRVYGGDRPIDALPEPTFYSMVDTRVGDAWPERDGDSLIRFECADSGAEAMLFDRGPIGFSARREAGIVRASDDDIISTDRRVEKAPHA